MSTDLLQDKKKALDAILDLVESGSAARDEIEREYRANRTNRTFDHKKDVAAWKAKYGAWYQTCWNWLSVAFDRPVLVLNRFRNPTIGLESPVGENAEWAGLIKNFNARLTMLDELYTAIASIQDEELSDYVEMKVGVPGIATLRLDKIISRWMK